jgi:hypothetical protein
MGTAEAKVTKVSKVKAMQETARRTMMAARLKAQAQPEGKKAGKDAPPVTIRWDSHQAVACFSGILYAMVFLSWSLSVFLTSIVCSSGEDPRFTSS